MSHCLQEKVFFQLLFKNYIIHNSIQYNIIYFIHRSITDCHLFQTCIRVYNQTNGGRECEHGPQIQDSPQHTQNLDQTAGGSGHPSWIHGCILQVEFLQEKAES